VRTYAVRGDRFRALVRALERALPPQSGFPAGFLAADIAMELILPDMRKLRVVPIVRRVSFPGEVARPGAEYAVQGRQFSTSKPGIAERSVSALTTDSRYRNRSSRRQTQFLTTGAPARIRSRDPREA